MNGLEDTYFSGYSRHLKSGKNHTEQTNIEELSDISDFEHKAGEAINITLPSNDFGGFSKARTSDRYGKAPDYFNFDYKDNFSDAENSNVTGFTNSYTEKSGDVFTALSNNAFKPLSSKNLIKNGGNKVPFTGQYASYANQGGTASKNEKTVNTFGMDAGGFKKYVL